MLSDALDGVGHGLLAALAAVGVVDVLLKEIKRIILAVVTLDILLHDV